MEESNQKRSDALKYTIPIIFILSGSVFDIVNAFVDIDMNLWIEIHLILKDLQVLGFAWLGYLIAPYTSLKIKAFLFMLVLWRASAFFFNIATDNIYTPVFDSVLYVVYSLWLYKIARINPDYMPSEFKNYAHFNVLLPVSTFRGMLQILFIPWANPKYETRVLVSLNKIYRVKNNKFVVDSYNPGLISELIENAGAKIMPCDKPNKKKLGKLIGKRVILGIRDCKRLEV